MQFVGLILVIGHFKDVIDLCWIEVFTDSGLYRIRSRQRLGNIILLCCENRYKENGFFPSEKLLCV